MKRKDQVNEEWMRMVGLPLHLCTKKILRSIGERCGGFIVNDKKIVLRTYVLWSRILVRVKEFERPLSINILAGTRSLELQICGNFPLGCQELTLGKGTVQCLKQSLRKKKCRSHTLVGECKRGNEGALIKGKLSHLLWQQVKKREGLH